MNLTGPEVAHVREFSDAALEPFPFRFVRHLLASGATAVAP
ncbi:MAG TPA: hypothetical protein VGS19_22580 [Streptosporangiaceae bacterium]|nr:hypothetical protein [Streptosporangiaceae bacterium]